MTTYMDVVGLLAKDPQAANKAMLDLVNSLSDSDLYDDTDDLLDKVGAWQCDGRYYTTCTSCGRDFELHCTFEEVLNNQVWVCGGSEFCIP